MISILKGKRKLNKQQNGNILGIKVECADVEFKLNLQLK